MEKMVLGTALAVWLVLGCLATARAENQPVVQWSSQVFSIADGQEGHLLDDTARRSIAGAITAMLHSLEAQGRLPFQLKEVSTEYNPEFSGEPIIGLVPIVMADLSFDSSYRIGEVTYYKSIIVSGLDLAFCSVDEDVGWRILGTIPIRSYKVLGNDLSHPFTEEISSDRKSWAYASLTMQSVREQMDFRHQKSLLRDLRTRTVWPETYQVTEVGLSSAKAQQVFAGHEQEIRDIVAGFFTSSYYQGTGRIVYPPRGGSGWKDDVARNLCSLQLNSPLGTMTVSMEKPRHAIRLDVYGLKKGELQTAKPSDVQRVMGYKAWLRQSPVEAGEKAEATRTTTRQFSKVDEDAIQLEDEDIFTELLIGAAQELGGQKRR